MSILLDALKKSEERRQLGKVPDIHSAVGVDSTAEAGRRRWVLLLLAGVVALGAAWFAWEKFRQPYAPAGSARDSARAVESPPGAAPEAVGPGPQASVSGEASPGKPPAVPRTPVETMASAAADTPSPAKQPPTASQQSDPQKSRVNESFTAFEADPSAVPKKPKPKQVAPTEAQRRAAAKAAAVVVPRQSVAEAQQRTPAEAQQRTPAEAQQRTPAEAQQRTPAEATAATVAVPRQAAAVNEQAAQPQPPVTEPISFWELPQGVRDTLPELRITVLVYAERPEDRFLLLGGQRLREKDEYQEGVVLDEIRRDGAVFLYRNYRFLIKG
jgi:general secretion pathway protein B